MNCSNHKLNGITGAMARFFQELFQLREEALRNHFELEIFEGPLQKMDSKISSFTKWSWRRQLPSYKKIAGESSQWAGIRNPSDHWWSLRLRSDHGGFSKKNGGHARLNETAIHPSDWSYLSKGKIQCWSSHLPILNRNFGLRRPFPFLYWFVSRRAGPYSKFSMKLKSKEYFQKVDCKKWRTWSKETDPEVEFGAGL